MVMKATIQKCINFELQVLESAKPMNCCEDHNAKKHQLCKIL